MVTEKDSFVKVKIVTTLFSLLNFYRSFHYESHSPNNYFNTEDANLFSSSNTFLLSIQNAHAHT